jgi:arylformamidase
LSWIFLSHILGEDSPGYGGASAFCKKEAKSIKSGDASNNSIWELSNHMGTHVDAPYHFDDAGLKVSDYSTEEWIFDRVYIHEGEYRQGQLIGPDGWEQKIPDDCELLLIRTGFEAHRAEKIYWEANPGLSPDLAAWLRSNRPQIRALGIDTISITSYQHREVGREAHRAFLGRNRPGNPILLIEDMKLGELSRNPKKVIVAPLLIKDADGSPVTVFAEI